MRQAVLALVLVLSGCGDDDDGPADAMPDTAVDAAPTSAILDLIHDEACPKTHLLGEIARPGDRVVLPVQFGSDRSFDLTVRGFGPFPKQPNLKPSSFTITVLRPSSGEVVMAPAAVGRVAALAGEIYDIVITMVERGDTPTYIFDLTCDCVGTTRPIQCGEQLSLDTSLGGARWNDSYNCPVGLGGALVLRGPEHQFSVTPAAGKLGRLTVMSTRSPGSIWVIDPGQSCGECNSAAESTGAKVPLALGDLDFPRRFTIDSFDNGGTYHVRLDCVDDCWQNPSGPMLACINAAPAYAREIRGRNDERGTAITADWGGCATGLSSQETVKVFQAGPAGLYTVRLTDLTADLDLLALQRDPQYGGCSPTGPCPESSLNLGTADEVITINAAVNEQRFLAIDGKPGALSPYRLLVSGPGCP